MSISDKLTKLSTDITNAYSAINTKGGIIPANKNTENLSSAISSIPSGGNNDLYDVLTNNGTNADGLFAYSFISKKITTKVKNYIENLDTSNFTLMQYLFFGNTAYSFDQRTLDLSNWDTSKVSSMTSMFNSCNIFTNLNLSGWDTSNVTGMNSMFNQNTNLIDLNITDWDTSNVSNMGYMFAYNTKLEIITGIIDMTKVTSLSYMFGLNSSSNSCIKLETVNIKNLNCTGLNLTYCTALSHDSLVYLINNLVTTSTTKTLTLGSTNLAKLTSAEIAVGTGKGWTIS